VQKQLGHSSFPITMDVYCRWFAGEGRGGLDEALKGGQSAGFPVPNPGGKPHIFAYEKKRPQ
jgi:hypothetical protein